MYRIKKYPKLLLSFLFFNKNTIVIQKRTFTGNVKAIKRIGPHNKDVISVIIGSLLGNCSSNKLTCSTRFIFRQNIKDKDFIF